MYVNQFDLTEKQIRVDTILSKQLQGKEKEHILKQSNQIEYDIPPKYHIGWHQIKPECQDEQLQETDNKEFVRSIMTEQAPKFYDRQRIENPTFRVPSGYFQVQAKIQTGNVTGCYYNTQWKIPICHPKDTQTSHKGKE